MMKRTVAFLAAAFAANAYPQFAVDLPFPQVLKELQVITLSDLGVGESGFVRSSTGFCRLIDGHIGLPKYTKLETERSE